MGGDIIVVSISCLLVNSDERDYFCTIIAHFLIVQIPNAHFGITNKRIGGAPERCQAERMVTSNER